MVLGEFDVEDVAGLPGGNLNLPITAILTYQVWSLTQFYSVDFLQSRIIVKSAFSTNAQSRFASVVVDGVLGPPRLARHT